MYYAEKYIRQFRFCFFFIVSKIYENTCENGEMVAQRKQQYVKASKEVARSSSRARQIFSKMASPIASRAD